MFNKSSESKKGVKLHWGDFSVDRSSDPTPAKEAVFEVLTHLPSRLTAQMTDDTSQALRLYTLKQTPCQREYQSPSLRKGREGKCAKRAMRGDTKRKHHIRL